MRSLLATLTIGRRLAAAFGALCVLLVVVAGAGLIGVARQSEARTATVELNQLRDDVLELRYLDADVSGWQGYIFAEAVVDGTAMFNNNSYTAGGAEMLYQALSGDGTSAIQLASGGGRGSDGTVDDSEAPNIKMSDMPKEIWLLANGRYYIVDGFRKPFQAITAGNENIANSTVFQLVHRLSVCFNGELSREEEVSRVAVGSVDELAFLAEAFYILSENNFHIYQFLSGYLRV